MNRVRGVKKVRGHGEEPHGNGKHRPGAVGEQPAPHSLPPRHNPHTTPTHSVDDYVFRNTKQRGEGEGVRGCVGQNLHPAYL